jgi:hypothetical protein
MEVNLLAVLAASVAALVVGVVWYLPAVLGRPWANAVSRYTGQSAEALLAPTNTAPSLGLWLLTAFVNAFILALLMRSLGTDTIGEALVLAVAAWAGFGLTFSSWPVLFGRQPSMVWFVNNGAFLLMQIVMAVILVVWR